MPVIVHAPASWCRGGIFPLSLYATSTKPSDTITPSNTINLPSRAD